MNAQQRLGTYLCVSAVWLAVILSSVDAGSQNQQIDPVVAFLREQVQHVQQTNADLANRTAAVQRMESIANSMVGQLDSDNEISVRYAATIYQILDSGRHSLEEASQNANSGAQRTFDIFQTAQAGVDQGQIPQSASAVLKEGQEALQITRLQLDRAKAALESAKKSADKSRQDLAQQGIAVPAPSAVRPTWLGIIGGVLPQGTVGQRTPGYVIVKNWDPDRRTGKLVWEFQGGTVEPASTDLDIPGGGEQRVSFTLVIPEGGKITYAPRLMKR